jgi:hypothetical protein
MQSAAPIRHEPKLKVMLRQVALELPDGFNPRTLALARQWRREAGNDDAAIVRRALEWIRAEFAYTLDTPPWDATPSTNSFLKPSLASASTSVRPLSC